MKSMARLSYLLRKSPLVGRTYWEHANNDYIIITSDRLEVKDSSGTEGMYYRNDI